MADRLTPIAWDDLVRTLRRLGFDGPFRGGAHPYMAKGDRVIVIPNPHRKEVGIALLVRVLRQAGITREEWIAAIRANRVD